MKKIFLIPAVVAVAAISSASAAGFAGGVSAGPLQVGQTNNLECAKSAKVIEWGYNDDIAVPNVVNVRVELTDANCAGQAVNVLPLKPDGTQYSPSRAAGKVPAQAAGRQVVRLTFNEPMNAEQLKSVRISIDPGFDGQPTGSLD